MPLAAPPGPPTKKSRTQPEITAKLLRRGIVIHEVPIRYVGRSFAEGKKISWRDFLSAVWTLVKLRVDA